MTFRAVHPQVRVERRALEIRMGDRSQAFSLASIEPHFGGQRWSIVCACGTRAQKLYAHFEWGQYRCRQCLGLRYRTERESAENRLYARATRYYRRAGSSPHAKFHTKPKRMRWRTFNRLIDLAEDYDGRRIEMGLARFEQSMRAVRNQVPRRLRKALGLRV